ncbi:hypothetical protein [Actinoplanes sp. NPDC089786]|uniref:hypothetical protein n=1 Tax=Actinoplanes sp. NPDC089786 TaxID=3155185 RepID=UPI00341EB9B6
MANFYVWLNRFDQGDGVAVVEVRRANVGRVVDGDPEFTQGLADAVSLPLTVRKWSIEPFRSLYYSDYPDADDWEDRFPEAWRVTLTGDPAGDGEVEPALRPATYNGYDSTWSPLRPAEPEPRGRYAAIGVLVGAIADDAFTDQVRAIRPDASVDTVVARSEKLRGTRVTVDLGTVDLAAAAAVDEVTGRLTELGMIVTRRAVELKLAELHS